MIASRCEVPWRRRLGGGRLCSACLLGCAALLLMAAPVRAGDRGPSATQLEAGCLERCASEGRDEAICKRYCDCNLETRGRGLSSEELERMIQLAASDERGAEQIRAWMRDTAISCRGKVFGSED